MSVCSLEFLVLLILGSAVFPWIPTVRLRQALLALANAAFLYTLIPDAKSWAALGLFAGSGYVIARTLQVYPKRWIFGCYLALLVLAFLVIKRYAFMTAVLPQSVFAQAVSIVGLSYLLFRQIHVVVDAYQGQIPQLSFWTYGNYQTNLFGVLAGPIQRYPEFAECWNSLAPVVQDTYDVLRAYQRIFIGIIKVALIAAWCLAVYDRQFHSLTVHPHQPKWEFLGRFLLVFYVYPVYVYLNFSGYCDIVIGGARLFGVRMPENFDAPFLSRNMIEYWTRWHITLGTWIRDYVFTPLYKALAERWPNRSALLGIFCFFVAFFIAGVWHGSTWNFVIFGLLNGLGVSAAKLWENRIIASRGRKGLKTYLQSNSIRTAAVIATFHFVCLTMYFFPADLHRSIQTAKVLGLQVLDRVPQSHGSE